ncbi:adhesion G-protein coupled receptor D1-like [Macrobrachium nipponense]|uniref:adhesion G-protein coupled receptor D1-like n=1 Tax=Macrobrachium nipponense TaxID=159736 RepID=UPI0030C7E41B
MTSSDLNWALGLTVLLGLAAVTQTADVDGGWSPWSDMKTPCSKTCQGGTQTKVRSCTNPAPEGNGKLCVKEDKTLTAGAEWHTTPCNTQACWVNEWSDWYNCSKVCGRGIKSRFAMCGNETCTGAQYKVEKEPCNTWVKNTSICPSPCIGKACPDYAICRDESTNEDPIANCVCTMGFTMHSSGKCVRPNHPHPPPPPGQVTDLPPAQKVVATVISKTASTIIIVMVSITLALFLILRIFTPDRIIQMNMEIALLCAHVMLMFPTSIVNYPNFCRAVSIFVHFFFTACFLFMMLEALHMYAFVGHVVKKDGMLSKVQNTLVGWGMAMFIVLCSMCFEFNNYGGKYHCWLQMDTPLVYGQYVPVIVIMVITLTLIEAAGAADFKQMKDIDEAQLLSAKFSQRTNLIIMPLVFSHWVVGMMSEYEQNMPLYSIFSILNGVTGVVVFLLHCFNNQQVREKMKGCFNKLRGKSKT